jgi:acyl transferase domain-containing protein
VVAGAEPALQRAEAACAAQGLRTVRLPAVGAFHSGLMAGAAAPLEAVAATLPHAAPRVPWISSQTGTMLTESEATDPTYWARQVVAPVQWAAAVAATAARAGAPAVWLELGPGHTLTQLVRGTTPLVAAAPTLDGDDADASVAQALGVLWAAGVVPDWPAVHGPSHPRRVALPTYPFQRQRYWLEPAAAEDLSRLFEKRDDRDAWYYRPSWRQAAPLSANLAAVEPRTWIVFADPLGVAPQVCARLEAAGHRCVVVEAGDRFEIVETDREGAPMRVAIRAGESGDYDALLDHLAAARHGTFDVVHAWSVALPGAPARDDGAVTAARRRGFDSLLLLARALTRVPAAQIRLNVVTSGACAVTGSEDLAAVTATVTGPARVIPAELPGVSSTLIDIAWPADGPERRAHAERLAAELVRESHLPVVAHRGAHRWVPGFEPLPAPALDAGLARLRPRGVYLITGGLGDIGLSIAELLARHVQARLVLVGRTGLPPRASWDGHRGGGAADRVARAIAAVRTLEALGAEVLVAAADVASLDQMTAVIDEARARFGAINGVVHAAGVPGAGTIALKSLADASAVLSAKVNGTVVLDRLLARERPDFVVLCSSLTAVLGGAGQSDYCAANAFLDAYAQRRWCLGDDTVTSINWDTWRDGGMAADAHVPADVAWRKAIAMESGLTRDEGQTAFLRALGARLPQVAVCTKDLAALASAMAAPRPPRPPREEPAAVTAHPRPALTTPYVAPERDSELRVCTAFERALGVDRVGVHDNFFELGGHSLLAVDLMARLNEQFGTTVPVAGLYEGLTPARVAQLFERQASPEARDDASAGRRREKGKRLAGARRRETRFERRQRS